MSNLAAFPHRHSEFTGLAWGVRSSTWKHVYFFQGGLVALFAVFAAAKLWKLSFDIGLDLIPFNLCIRGGPFFMLDES